MFDGDYDNALSSPTMFKSELLEMKMRESMSREKFLEAMTNYQATLQSLIEINNTREMADKEKLHQLEKELKRHKSLIESIEILEYKYIEARSLIENFEENETKLIAELTRTTKESLAYKASYDALVKHTQQKLKELQSETEKMKEQNNMESSTLKARIVRCESQNQILHQSLETKDKENNSLRDLCQKLVEKLEKGDRFDGSVETIKAQLSIM